MLTETCQAALSPGPRLQRYRALVPSSLVIKEEPESQRGKLFTRDHSAREMTKPGVFYSGDSLKAEPKTRTEGRWFPGEVTPGDKSEGLEPGTRKGKSQ